MPLHFERAEYDARLRVAREQLEHRGLDGLLAFRQESMYYLTGYDTFGYVYFQCLYLGADGTLTLLTRTPDSYLARFTSIVEDVRVWQDGHNADPPAMLRMILDEHGCRGRRLGVEYDAYGLTGANALALQGALEGFVELDDASDLVSRLRLVKRPAEIEYVRRAAALADDILDACIAHAAPGAFEGDILAEMQGTAFRGDGDYPANEYLIGSGPGALMGRYYSGRRHLDARDQLTVEFAGVYRHYHACLMRTIAIGEAPARQRELHAVALDAMAACMETCAPGRTVGDVFAAYARVCDEAGFGDHRLAACGYALGATFAPNWMDWPMFYAGNPVVIEPGMTFFIQSVLVDGDAGVIVTPAHTVLTSDTGCESLSRHDLDLIVRP